MVGDRSIARTPTDTSRTLTLHRNRSLHDSEFLLHPPEPLSLRLASNLMVGVSRVYGQQVNFYASDVSAVLVQVKYSFSQALDASASKLVGQARTENITLGGNLPGTY